MCDPQSGEAEALCFFLSQLEFPQVQTESGNCLEVLYPSLCQTRKGQRSNGASLRDREENQGCGLGCNSMAEHFYSMYEALGPTPSIRKKCTKPTPTETRHDAVDSRTPGQVFHK